MPIPAKIRKVSKKLGEGHILVLKALKQKQSKQHQSLRRISKRCWYIFAGILLTMAILFTCVRALTPWVKQYKAEIETKLSAVLGERVRIDSIQTSWYWFEPVLKLNHLRINDKENHILQVKKLLVGVDMPSSLWNWELKPGILYLDSLHLRIREENNQWKLDGIDNQSNLDWTAIKPVLDWILSQQKILIKNVSAELYFSNGKVLPLNKFDLLATNQSGHYRLQTKLHLDKNNDTAVSLQADFKINTDALNKTRGKVYISLENAQPALLMQFYPIPGLELQSGLLNLQSWLEFSKGSFQTIQSKLSLHDLSWLVPGKNKNQKIDELTANLAWKPTADGWQLSGDDIKLSLPGQRWPANKILINYQQADGSYQIFIHKILLKSLQSYANDYNWPPKIQEFFKMQILGELSDTQIHVQGGKVQYLLARFINLAWKRFDSVPGMRNISGVFYWRPDGGGIELDAKNSLIDLKKTQVIQFNDINAEIHWKNLGDKLRVSIEDLVFSRNDLVLSLKGSLDNLLSAKDTEVHLAAELSATDAQKWMAYIPAKALKPKLNKWLKEDVKQIRKITAQAKLDGAIKDFPFDNKPGYFSVSAHVLGLDLVFNREWPLTQNIDAFLHVNKRRLEADIQNADMQGIPVQALNLLIEDMGHGKELMLIHGQIHSEAEKILDYIAISPLRKHLNHLKQVAMSGLLGLELKLEIPLYGENEKNYALGKIQFENNEATIHNRFKDLHLDAVNGSLQFDEKGVTDSDIQAKILGYPVNIYAQSNKQKDAYTSIRVVGNTSIDLLSKQISLPIWPLFQGDFKVEALFTLTDKRDDLDHVKISSSLEGVAIDLPKPFGKEMNSAAPLRMDIGFNPEKLVQISFNYNNQLTSSLFFPLKGQDFVLEKAAFNVGSGAKAELPTEPGIHISGILADFDPQYWQNLGKKLAPENPADNANLKFVDAINSFDLGFNSLHFMQQDYPNIQIQGKKLAKDEWKLGVRQENLVADLQYNLEKKNLSGHFEHWYWKKSKPLSNSLVKDSFELKPEQIPNLDIQVDDFRVEEREIGQLDFKSQSLKDLMKIEKCSIKSKAYELSLKGDWFNAAPKRHSSVEAEISLRNLSETLKRWDITPAVEAKRGSISFKGSWPGAFYDFSLPKVTGEMYITLKNGRITHLDKETEEKLGLGKLLSVLSLQTIPRRLQLDFSDLAQGGYSFDEFKGDFDLMKGVMHTQDSHIDGPVAYASMKGDLDLVKRLYDIDLQVSPHITASLPIVATIAGGPIAGVAAWVASKIINQGMQKITSYGYKITGPWSKPEVQQISIEKAKKE